MPAIRNDRPKTIIDQLTAQAPTKAVSDLLGLDKYYRSAELLESQARQYRSSRNDEQLYVMLMRYASLILETIPRHKDFTKSDGRYVRLRQRLAEAYISELESLKHAINLKHLDAPPVAASRNRPGYAQQLITSDLPQLDWASSMAMGAAAGAAASSSGQHQAALQVDDLLDILAHGSGPATAAPSAPPLPSTSLGGPGMSQGQAQLQPRLLTTTIEVAPVALPTYSSNYTSSYRSVSGDRHALFARSGSNGRPAAAAPPYGGTLSQYQRPMPKYPTLMDQDAAPMPSSSSGAQAQPDALADGLGSLSLMGNPSAGPSLGPQEVEVQNLSVHTHDPGANCSAPPPPPPPPPLALPPASSSSPGGGMKEVTKKAALRDVHVSMALMNEFLAYAASNTRKGVESCGILAGKLLADDSMFAITTLIIPKQQGTSDTVQALNEEEIFDAQFQRELYPLGWIHTHPTQTCFLSSIDIHTQCGYQTMLEEAVAIVMAPTDPTGKRCGIFRLSTPGGLTLVQKCQQRGFHSHPSTDSGQDIYELCGHVFLNPRCQHEIIDLR